MQKRNKYAWTWTIKEEHLEEYVRMHRQPWEDVLEEHRKAGISNYSIFQNGRQFFYCFECNNIESAFAYIAKSTICARWNAITSTMVEGSFNFDEPTPIRFLEEVFYLE